jgi:hypothetical protein
MPTGLTQMGYKTVSCAEVNKNFITTSHYIESPKVLLCRALSNNTFVVEFASMGRASQMVTGSLQFITLMCAFHEDRGIFLV